MNNKQDFIVRLELEKYKDHDREKLFECVDEFINFIDQAYGFYHDTLFGFNLILKQLPDSENQVFYTKEDPNKGKIKLRMKTSAKEVRARNASFGVNRKLAFQILVTSIYAKWEHKFRKSISVALGLGGKKQLGRINSDIMGALRHLRNHIEHANGFIPEKDHGLTALHQIELFSQLKIGDEIFFNDDNYFVYEIIREIKKDLDRIIISATGTDPLYRKIWYLD